MLLAQFLLLSHDDVELVLLSTDIGLNCSDFGLQFLSSTNFAAEVDSVGSSLAFILLRLGQDVVIGDLRLIDLVVDSPQLVLRPLRLLILQLQLGNQLLVVVLSLMKCLIKLSVDRLVIPYQPLKILEFLGTVVEQGIEAITLLLQSLALILQSLDSDG